ncbi:hypothetical protein V8C86DRAFT_2455464, partial [Haematococcus lacustris]
SQPSAPAPDSQPAPVVPSSSRGELRAIEPVIAEIRAFKTAVSPADMAAFAAAAAAGRPPPSHPQLVPQQLAKLSDMLGQLQACAARLAARHGPTHTVAHRLGVLHRDLAKWAAPVLSPCGLAASSGGCSTGAGAAVTQSLPGALHTVPAAPAAPRSDAGEVAAGLAHQDGVGERSQALGSAGLAGGAAFGPAAAAAPPPPPSPVDTQTAAAASDSNSGSPPVAMEVEVAGEGCAPGGPLLGVADPGSGSSDSRRESSSRRVSIDVAEGVLPAPTSPTTTSLQAGLPCPPSAATTPGLPNTCSTYSHSGLPAAAGSGCPSTALDGTHQQGVGHATSQAGQPAARTRHPAAAIEADQESSLSQPTSSAQVADGSGSGFSFPVVNAARQDSPPHCGQATQPPASPDDRQGAASPPAAPSASPQGARGIAALTNSSSSHVKVAGAVSSAAAATSAAAMPVVLGPVLGVDQDVGQPSAAPTSLHLQQQQLLLIQLRAQLAAKNQQAAAASPDKLQQAATNSPGGRPASPLRLGEGVTSAQPALAGMAALPSATASIRLQHSGGLAGVEQQQQQAAWPPGAISSSKLTSSMPGQGGSQPSQNPGHMVASLNQQTLGYANSGALLPAMALAPAPQLGQGTRGSLGLPADLPPPDLSMGMQPSRSLLLPGYGSRQQPAACTPKLEPAPTSFKQKLGSFFKGSTSKKG